MENSYVGKSVQLVDRVFCLVELLYEVGFGRVFLWLDCISFCVCRDVFVPVGQMTTLARVTLPDAIHTQPGR